MIPMPTYEDRTKEIHESVEYDTLILLGFWLLYEGFVNNDPKASHCGGTIIDTMRRLNLFDMDTDLAHCSCILHVKGIDSIKEWDRGEEFSHHIEVELNRARVICTSVKTSLDNVDRSVIQKLDELLDEFINSNTDSDEGDDNADESSNV